MESHLRLPDSQRWQAPLPKRESQHQQQQQQGTTNENASSGDGDVRAALLNACRNGDMPQVEAIIANGQINLVRILLLAFILYILQVWLPVAAE